MPGISLVLAVFVCTPDALYCIDQSRDTAYADPPSCQAEAELRRHELRDVFGPDKFVFTRCRYVMRRTARHPDARLGRGMM